MGDEVHKHDDCCPFPYENEDPDRAQARELREAKEAALHHGSPYRSRCSYRGSFSDGSDQCGNEAGCTGPHYSNTAKYPLEKPRGLDSGIALMVQRERDLERMVYEKQQTVLKSSGPGAFFGLDRTMKCCFPDCVTDLKFETFSYAVKNTVQIHAKYGLEGATLRTCKACFDKHSIIPPRRPAIEPQKKAVEGVEYRVWFDYMRDEYLIVAKAPDFSGRMLRVDGRVWKVFSMQTNAPDYERPLLDDDYETMLQVSKDIVEYITPLSPARSLATIATDLEADLFCTDPDVVAYVRTLVDLLAVPSPLYSEENVAVYKRALCIAYSRACEGKEPEAAWMKRATERMRAIETRREEKSRG